MAIVHRSVTRLLVAEAGRQGLTQHSHGRELDALYEAICRTSHAQRLSRLADLGERTEDLDLPNPPR